MLMYYALYISLGTLILGVLVINKDMTLQVLNNISFKWVFDKSGEKVDKKQEGQVQIKDMNKVKLNGHFSRYVGTRLALLGGLFLLIVGIGWLVADFQPVLNQDSKIYLDDPNMGRDLISIQMLLLGMFVLIILGIGIKFSNEEYEKKIFEKLNKEVEKNDQ